MATNSGWSKEVPSGLSRIADGDDAIRSFKSHMQAWWEDEHYATDGSTSSAGKHKLGSARAFVGTTSQLSNPTGDNDGRLMFTSNTTGLYVAHGSASTWKLLTNNIALGSSQTWTGTQEFSHAVLSNITIKGQGASSWTIQGVVSGFSRLAATITIAADADAGFAMTVQNSDLTFGDPVLIGLQDNDATTPDVMATAQVNSSGSVYVRVQNVGVVSRDLTSGTTVRFVGFKSNR